MFNRWTQSHPAHDDGDGRTGQQAIWSRDAVANILARSDLTPGLSAEQQARLGLLCHVRRYDGGELVCDEYEHSDELYVIAAGVVEVWLDPQTTGDDYSALRRLGTMEVGELCGEVALLDNGVRSAQLRAGPSGTELLVIPKAKLLGLCSDDTPIGYLVMRNIATVLARRLRLRRM